MGKRGGSWDSLVEGGSPRGLISDGRHQALAAEVSWQPAEPRPLLTLLPRWKSFSMKLTKQNEKTMNNVLQWRRIGRSEREKEDGSVALLEGKTHLARGLF